MSHLLPEDRRAAGGKPIAVNVHAGLTKKDPLLRQFGDVGPPRGRTLIFYNGLPDGDVECAEFRAWAEAIKRGAEGR